MPEANNVDPYLYGVVGSIFLCLYLDIKLVFSNLFSKLDLIL